MSKEAVFTMKLEPELRAEFMAEAEATHRPASQIVRELMREFVQRQRQAREYDDFLRGKVADAREQIHAGEYASADEVEARVAARRAQLLAKAAAFWNMRVFWASALLSKTAPTSSTTSARTTRSRPSGWMSFLPKRLAVWPTIRTLEKRARFRARAS
jgi:predicted transcriptional regulator